MTFPLTTKARIKNIEPAYTDGTKDALLDQFIEAISFRVERFLDRSILIDDFTEIINLTVSSCAVYWLKNFPVTAISKVDNDDFLIPLEDVSFLDNKLGRIGINDNILFGGFGRLKIDYTGGMATDTADFIAKFPDIAHEMDLQVIFEIGKSRNLVDKQIGIDEQSTTKYDLGFQTSFKNLLRRHRRKIGLL